MVNVVAVVLPLPLPLYYLHAQHASRREDVPSIMCPCTALRLTLPHVASVIDMAYACRTGRSHTEEYHEG